MIQAIKLVLERLDALFRYVLPGAVVLGVAYMAHPSWFAFVRGSPTPSLTPLAGLALTLGAFTYTLHRFTVHQGLDYISWKWFNARGQNYRAALRAAVEKGVPKNKRNHHIAVRSSQLIFLFISLETLFIFTVLSPEADSVFGAHAFARWALLAGAVIAFPFAVWQYSLVNDLDRTLTR